MKTKIYRNGNLLGEYTDEEIDRMIFEGLLHPFDTYWHEGMAEPRPLRERPITEAWSARIRHEADSARSIAEDVSFQPYLDAVTDSSKRSRATLYVIIVTVLAMFVAYRNIYYPKWLRQRLVLLQIERLRETREYNTPAGAGNIISEATDSARQYTNSYAFSDDIFRVPVAHAKSEKSPAVNQATAGQNSAAPPAIAGTGPSQNVDTDPFDFADLGTVIPARELDEFIQQFIRKRADLTTVQVPILGLQVDINDIGLIGGLFIIALLFILCATLRRETLNLWMALNRVRYLGELHLLAMGQVLSFASSDKRLISRVEKNLLNLAVYCIIGLPGVMLFFIYKKDEHDPRRIGDNLIGHSANQFERHLEFGVLVTVIILSGVCVFVQTKLNRAFAALDEKLETMAAAKAKTKDVPLLSPSDDKLKTTSAPISI